MREALRPEGLAPALRIVDKAGEYNARANHQHSGLDRERLHTFFANANQSTDSSQYKNVISVIKTVDSRALAKDFQSATLYSALNEAVQKCVRDTPSVDVVAVTLADAPPSR